MNAIIARYPDIVGFGHFGVVTGEDVGCRKVGFLWKFGGQTKSENCE